MALEPLFSSLFRPEGQFESRERFVKGANTTSILGLVRRCLCPEGAAENRLTERCVKWPLHYLGASPNIAGMK